MVTDGGFHGRQEIGSRIDVIDEAGVGSIAEIVRDTCRIRIAMREARVGIPGGFTLTCVRARLSHIGTRGNTLLVSIVAIIAKSTGM